MYINCMWNEWHMNVAMAGWSVFTYTTLVNNWMSVRKMVIWETWKQIKRREKKLKVMKEREEKSCGCMKCME